MSADHQSNSPASEARSTPSPNSRLGRPINGFALLACIIIIGGAILLSVRLGSIDFYSAAVSPMPSPEEIASFCVERHAQVRSRVDMPPTHTTMDAAAFELGSKLQLERFIVFDLSDAGFAFVGADLVELPASRLAAHLRYRQNRSSGAVNLSIFVPDDAVASVLVGPETRGISPPRWHWLSWQVLANGDSTMVLQGMHDTSVLFLVSDSQLATDAVAETLTLQPMRW